MNQWTHERSNRLTHSSLHDLAVGGLSLYTVWRDGYVYTVATVSIAVHPTVGTLRGTGGPEFVTSEQTAAQFLLTRWSSTTREGPGPERNRAAEPKAEQRSGVSGRSRPLHAFHPLDSVEVFPPLLCLLQFRSTVVVMIEDVFRDVTATRDGSLWDIVQQVMRDTPPTDRMG